MNDGTNKAREIHLRDAAADHPGAGRRGRAEKPSGSAPGAGRPAAQNAQANEFLTETVPAWQKIITAEDQVISLVTGGQTAFNDFQQSILGAHREVRRAPAASRTRSSSPGGASPG